MALRTDNFRKILQQSLGIAQFYTFSLKEAADVLQAVPDGSVDLLFEKKEISFGRLSGERYCRRKNGRWKQTAGILEYVFCRDSVFCPKDSQPKSWSMRISRYPETLMETI